MTDRCPTCGMKPRGVWHRQAMLDAARAWAAAHEGAAPTMRQWRRSSPDHPPVTHTALVFGSWNAYLREAGLPTRQQGASRAVEWTREQASAALFAWVYEHGRLPIARDWHKRAPARPTRQQVEGLFGSWNAFIVVSGYEPVKSFRGRKGYSAQAAAATKRHEKATA